MIIEVKNYKCICDRCAHAWTTRNDQLPAVCPRCKSKLWNTGSDPGVRSNAVISVSASLPAAKHTKRSAVKTEAVKQADNKHAEITNDQTSSVHDLEYVNSESTILDYAE